MAYSMSFSSPATNLCPTHIHKHPFLSFPLSISVPNQNPTTKLTLQLCLAAAKSQTGPVKKTNNRKKKKKVKNDVEIVDDDVEIVVDEAIESSDSGSFGYQPTPLPKPPAGFVVDDTGRVLMASNKRIATIVSSFFHFSFAQIVIFLLLQISSNITLSSACSDIKEHKHRWLVSCMFTILYVSDKEVDGILPTAAYALAKIHMHLVHSGFCYTARGGFCYSEDDIFDFRTGNDPLLNILCSLYHLTSFDSLLFGSTAGLLDTSDDGQDVDGVPTEGVEITCFNLDGAHYMIYTPSDPLLFVAVKDGNGQLQIADDELLDDPAIISAIDEETEFNALVEEEAALLESLLGFRELEWSERLAGIGKAGGGHKGSKSRRTNRGMRSRDARLTSAMPQLGLQLQNTGRVRPKQGWSKLGDTGGNQPAPHTLFFLDLLQPQGARGVIDKASLLRGLARV
ncbi:hypothetical protein EZV62_014856 [Acer yangbiense]|uniref:Uncharacterized protein n=1 Tax=Acer yangbiense TaxID=1000413 RepID=A0A5C7HT50_9ROSI|nr:hypothetical protein EZV62_014856 [Acer yangbiense]